MIKTGILIFFCLMGSGIGWGQQPQAPAVPIDYEKMGQALLTAIMKGNIEEYRALLTPNAATKLTPDVIRKLGADLTARFGKLSAVQVGERQQTGLYHRVLYDCVFAKGKTTMVVVLENGEKIASIFFPEVPTAKPPPPPSETSAPAPTGRETPAPFSGPAPAPSSLPSAPETARPVPEIKTNLHLPLSGKWKVVNGGKDPHRNYHNVSKAERYAYDFVIVGIDNRSFKIDGKKNEDYYAFGKEVVAPADGIVIQVIDGIEDNVPGQTNHYFAPGNTVIVDHQNGEFSVLSHLAKGSIKVRERQRVKQGDLLGLCGNSGDSPEPHVHYHLQDQPRLVQANGLPITFQNYYSGNRPVEKGTPEFNESVAN